MPEQLAPPPTEEFTPDLPSTPGDYPELMAEPRVSNASGELRTVGVKYVDRDTQEPGYVSLDNNQRFVLERGDNGVGNRKPIVVTLNPDGTEKSRVSLMQHAANQEEAREQREGGLTTRVERVVGDIATEVATDSAATKPESRYEGRDGIPESVVFSDGQIAAEHSRAGNTVELNWLQRGLINGLVLETDDGQMYEIKSFFIPEDSINLSNQHFSLITTADNKDRDPSQPRVERSLTKKELEEAVVTVGEPLILEPDANGKRIRTRGNVTKVTYWATRMKKPLGSPQSKAAKESDLLERFAEAVHDVEFDETHQDQQDAEKIRGQQSAAGQIFIAISRRLGNIARSQTTRKEVHYNPTTGETTYPEVTVNPAKAYVKEMFDKLGSDLLGRVNFKKTASQIMRHLESGNFEESTAQNGKVAIGEALLRTEELISSGRVDSVTANYFWENVGMIGGNMITYSDLVDKEDRVEIQDIDRVGYARGVREALSIFDPNNIYEQESGGFLHINSGLVTGENSQEPIERLYISAKPDGDPGEVIKIWTEMLDDLGLKDSVYFKVPINSGQRYESIVMYRLEGMNDEEFGRLIEEFTKRCPRELLDPEPMPTGMELVPGIFTAPEPSQMKRLLRYATRTESGYFKQVSYNSLISSLTVFAMNLATSELRDKGIDESKVTPKQLAGTAERYFEELVLLSGIDPETMTNIS